MQWVYYLYVNQKLNIQKNSQEIDISSPNKNSIDPLQCEGGLRPTRSRIVGFSDSQFIECLEILKKETK